MRFSGFFRDFFRELKTQCVTLSQLVRTREFWVYVGVIVLFALIAAAGIRLATGFDPLTRGQLNMSFSCRTGEGQLATIIVGFFVFAIACLFTLGEVVSWVEETRESKAPGRMEYEVSYWPALLSVIGTIVLGVSGYALMATWCT